MQQSASDITLDMQALHKEVLRNSVLNSTLPNSLLGGQPAQDVIQRGHYTPLSVCAFKHNFDEVKRGDWETLEDVMSREFPPGSEGRRVVLHGGIGMGKTTAVEKIIWDWTSGTRLQHYTLLLRVCVEELSTLGEKTDSLCSLLIRTHSHLSPESLVLALQRPQSLLLLLDGLKRFPNLLSAPPPTSSFICDVQHQATGTVLLYSLLHGSLLPDVSMLVTSTESINLKSLRSFEILGFSKTQRRMFFQQFFGDGSQAERFFWHSEQALGVYEQYFCPAFCWTLCSVFKTQFESKETLPETLTHLFSIITNMLLQKQKMNVEQSRELVSGLSRLAFIKSTKSEVISCGLLSFLHSPVLPAFLCINGDVTSPDTTFSFLSPVMQEFLMAASFYINQSDVLKEALEERTDLYYTFLAGLSDSAQRKPIEDSVGSFNESRISEFSQWLVGTASAVLPGFDKKQHYRVLRLLLHTRNSSLVKESISKCPWRHRSYSDMQESDCTALSYVVSCVGELEHMNLYGAYLTDEQAERLLPALRLSKSIGLSQSRLSLGAITHLATALAKGRATELDLSYARLEHGAVKIICDSLTNSTLQSLMFRVCSLTAADCEALAGMLSGGSKLRVLDLFGNDLLDQGLIQLSSVLGNCTLHEINLDRCSLTHASMSALSSALTSGYSKLKTLNLSRNAVTDDGMDCISKALQTAQCQLNTLNVFDCQLTGSCCSSLAAALQSEHSSLTELELSVNELGQSGMLICEALKAPNCMLEKLGMARCELTVEMFRELESVLTSGMSRLVSLTVGLNAVGDTGAKHMWGALRHKNCKLQHLDLEMLSLTDACVEELCESVAASSTLSTLSLKINGLTDSSVPQLVKLMQDHPIMSNLNLQYNDFSEDVFELMETCPKIRY
ncbi:NACHT, LRR and PYD domains-containing protein 3 [Myxocyprinus asiaticus]|uniref:NACHT, LRR and PYD domains-containing protein 3 n=1 Tax=Myxocyprinus asiaticus TaxID=70543 RepID=UPI00222377F0|nr:NACHT, LRR and PYD domains-containing protein 3 [Myxocyprinus asiaticus]XP_051525132.1 NACHT, LRR and PYD domains-containing protein 3 [Myxocyprinus asiaticus]XP_051525133.1 NACHT, LRR and PYD domains-containing protein 3 [Myxocyprinus asiaticus]XP_051525134.1 NACHT, LRR and PYD domains-containing protein 3 [Myxocyprinus asiaticus]